MLLGHARSDSYVVTQSLVVKFTEILFVC
jgi:hypothetical protein